MPQVKLLEKLERMNGGRDSLAGWRRVLGADFDEVRPLLAAVTGERASTYPCPVFGTSLMVRERLGGNGYVAFASGDDAGADDEDLMLTWEDVQAWALDEGKIEELLRMYCSEEQGQDKGDGRDLCKYADNDYWNSDRARLNRQLAQTRAIETGTIRAVKALLGPALGKKDNLDRCDPVGGETVTCRRFGGIQVYGDYESILLNKASYDLSGSAQGKAFFRFMCESAKAIGQQSAVTKNEIEAYVRTHVECTANDWRPAHVFRGKLKGLYDAIGRHKTKGLYWIKT